MPPAVYSRHILTTGVSRVDDGLTYLLDREPLRFRPLSGNRRVRVASSDTWQTLAAAFFVPIQNPHQLWWVICDFQPEPVLDPTVPPVSGTYVYIPSVEFVLAEVFSRDRKAEALI